MRYFKKEGNVKFKKSDDGKYIEGLIKLGWEECDNKGVSVSSVKPKRNRGEKVDVGENSSD